MSNEQKEMQAHEIQLILQVLAVRMVQLCKKVQNSNSTKKENIELAIYNDFSQKLLQLRTDVLESKKKLRTRTKF